MRKKAWISQAELHELHRSNQTAEWLRALSLTPRISRNRINRRKFSRLKRGFNTRSLSSIANGCRYGPEHGHRRGPPYPTMHACVRDPYSAINWISLCNEGLVRLGAVNGIKRRLQMHDAFAKRKAAAGYRLFQAIIREARQLVIACELLQVRRDIDRHPPAYVNDVPSIAKLACHHCYNDDPMPRQAGIQVSLAIVD